MGATQIRRRSDIRASSGQGSLYRQRFFPFPYITRMNISITGLLRRLKSGFWKFLAEPSEWIVLVGNRLVVAGLLTTVFALGLGGVLTSGVVAFHDSTQMVYVFEMLVGGNITLLTIVLSINQLVLSREFNAPGQVREDIQNVVSYRHDVEETTNRNQMPVTPADFLAVLLHDIRDTAQRLDGLIDGSANAPMADDVDSLASGLSDRSDHILTVLDRSGGGIFTTLAAAIERDFSRPLNEVRRIRTVYDDDLPADASDLIATTEDSLKQLDIARQYFRSIYIQTELAGLSKILLYVGLPAVGSALLVLLVYAGAANTPIQMTYLDVFVPTVVILGFSPLAVLFAFVLRIATVARLTVAITPFTTPTQNTEIGD